MRCGVFKRAVVGGRGGGWWAAHRQGARDAVVGSSCSSSGYGGVIPQVQFLTILRILRSSYSMFR